MSDADYVPHFNTTHRVGDCQVSYRICSTEDHGFFLIERAIEKGSTNGCCVKARQRNTDHLTQSLIALYSQVP